jgi:outer membrane protein assembly factor BamB
MPGRRKVVERAAGMVAAVALLATAMAGCSDGLPQLPRISELNPFAEKEVPLPGKRVPIALAENKAGLEVAAADRPIVLPPAQPNESWAQPGGLPNNSPGNLAFGGSTRTAWTADAGAGSSSYGRLTASPIVAEGKVFTLDANGRVTAFSASGSVAWRVALAPPSEKEYTGFGGGLAAEPGRIVAATGFGIVYGLESGSGKKLWEKNLLSPVRSSPTIANGKVFVITSDGTARALSTTDGQELWAYQGLPEKASILTNASPAVDGDTVVVPYPNGELIALRVSDGTQVWTESLARTRLASSLGSLTDTGRPAIDGGTVFAVGHSGRMVATNVKSGERLWSLNVPGIQPPAVVGEIVYVVDSTGQLMAITRRDGKVMWTVKLPEDHTWSGPLVAGSKLWLTSNKGQLVSVEATTGKIDSRQNLGAPIYIAPIVASGRMYVMTDKARLIALN